MRYPWANIALLVLLVSQLITGFFGFINGEQNNQWLLWLHGIGAYSIVLLFLWKSAIILDVYQRRSRLSWLRFIFGFMVFLTIATMISGLIWTFDGPFYFFGFSLITLHIFLAIPLIFLLVWHAWKFRWILTRSESRSRRTFLKTAGISILGVFFWRSTGSAKSAFNIPGADRRFTGSYEIGSFTGVFPQVSWIADRPSKLDLDSWHLTIDGQVDNPISLTYELLIPNMIDEKTEILDCTGGWYSNQLWQGVKVSRLLAMAGVRETAQSVTFESISGYSRRFGLREAGEYLLAMKVSGQLLSHGHGFPARLVAPGQRGVNWVKWVNRIRINRSGKLWQLPLPFQ